MQGKINKHTKWLKLPEKKTSKSLSEDASESAIIVDT